MKERDAQNILKRYFTVFQHAWNNFLENVEKGVYFVPSNEAELRCFLFAECLEMMSRKKFEKPYEIFAEDKEISEGSKADIALGWLEDGRFVAIELKHGPHLKTFCASNCNRASANALILSMGVSNRFRINYSDLRGLKLSVFRKIYKGV